MGEAATKQLSCQADDPCYAGAVFIDEGEFVKANDIAKIDFPKCDIEGGEFGLLSRSNKLLALSQRIAIEVHVFAGNIKEFIQMLLDASFIIGPVKWEPDGSGTLLGKRPEV